MRSIFLIFLAFSLAFYSCNESLEERAARESREYTEKNCPIPLNRYITLDSMTFETTSHTFNYYYSLSPQLDPKNLNIQGTKNEMLSQLKNATSLRTYKDAGYSFRYIYYMLQNPKERLIDIKFTAKDY